MLNGIEPKNKTKKKTFSPGNENLLRELSNPFQVSGHLHGLNRPKVEKLN
jgi:hypothetical protein